MFRQTVCLLLILAACGSDTPTETTESFPETFVVTVEPHDGTEPTHLALDPSPANSISLRSAYRLDPADFGLPPRNYYLIMALDSVEVTEIHVVYETMWMRHLTGRRFDQPEISAGTFRAGRFFDQDVIGVYYLHAFGTQPGGVDPAYCLFTDDINLSQPVITRCSLHGATLDTARSLADRLEPAMAEFQIDLSNHVISFGNLPSTIASEDFSVLFSQAPPDRHLVFGVRSGPDIERRTRLRGDHGHSPFSRFCYGLGDFSATIFAFEVVLP